MTFEEVVRRLAELDYQPLTSPEAGKLLYTFVAGSDVEDVLELGFAHGTSTAYIAAALGEKGAGSITTIDRERALSRCPNIHQVVEALGLESLVRPIVSASSYNWELMRLLDEQTSDGRTAPCFDFCFIDGAHTWETDGFAFLLVDRLLRADRWLLFDDLEWTIATSPAKRSEQGVSHDEATTRQVSKVFDLLVRPHPAYSAFVVSGRYGWAYKAGSDGDGRHRHDVERLVGPELLRLLLAGRAGAG